MSFHPMLEEPQSLKREPSLSYYEKGKRIGSGGQGTVYEYTQAPNEKGYAVKVLYNGGTDGNTKHMRNILREQSASPEFVHTHLMKAHNVFEYPEGFAIVMPHYPRGNLDGLELDPIELKHAVRQILEALQHLHDLDYIHRDIKSANILVSSREGEAIHVVVADYGLLTSENPVTYLGTPGYMAPEITANGKPYNEVKQYDNKVDIYALGILLLRMLGLDTPWHGFESQTDFTKRIKSLIAKACDTCPQNDFDRFDILTMADWMLQFAATIRPSADECLKHPCLAPATAAPAALKRARSDSVSTNRSGASLPPNPPAKDYWDETTARGRSRHRRGPKRGPLAPPVPYFRVSKPKHHLPTPKSTPTKANKARKFDDEESEKLGQLEDAPISNWDEMPLSE